jgi:hypothetical protein
MADDEGEGEGEGEGEPLNYYHLPTWIYWILWVLILLAIISSVGSWAFVYRYRKKPIVAMSQPTFMYNLCFGSLLLPISLVLYMSVQLSGDRSGIFPIGRVENVCCHFMMWLYYLGLFVIYSALLCKIYRIMKVTQQPLRRGLKILPRHALWPFIVVLMLTIGLLIAWSITNPSNKYIVEEIPNTTLTTGYCEISGIAGYKSASVPYLYALQALILIVQLILTILACKIKNLNEELGDSKRIFRLVLFQFILHSIITCLLFFGAAKVLNLASRKSVFSLQFIMYSFSTIGFMIMPRMYYVWYEYRHGHLPEYVVMIGSGTTTVRGTNATTDAAAAAAAAVTGNISIINNVDDDANNHGNNDGEIETAVSGNITTESDDIVDTGNFSDESLSTR